MAEEPIRLPPPTEPVMALVDKAIERGMSPDQLGKLLDLARQWRADREAEAFANALARFQAECPPVQKGRAVMNKDGKTVRYKFAGFEDVMRLAGPHLAANGISVSFWTPEVEGTDFVITCRLQVGAHYQDRSFRAPRPDMQAIAKSMYMSEPQAFGFVLSYFKRYAFCAAAGVVVCDEDNDAAIGPDQVMSAQQAATPITKEQQTELRDLLDVLANLGHPADLNRFCKIYGANAIKDIKTSEYPKALSALAQAIAKKQREREEVAT
jgi:hypothetical protein